ncbi:MAG TPA: hypothetical protein VMS30_01675 [Phycisphaerales bacterium]|nr:hypothetical protein [Phycisphaerales bacterium]
MTDEDRHSADAERLFTEFVAHRDVQCPRCDYSLRNAMHPRCPECGEPLRLAISTEGPIMGALLTTVAPGLGCGICSLIFAALIVVHPGAPGPIVIATFLMFLSGIAALVIVSRRRAFMRQSREHQRVWAIVSIAIHTILFLILLLSFD